MNINNIFSIFFIILILNSCSKNNSYNSNNININTNLKKNSLKKNSIIYSEVILKDIVNLDNVKFDQPKIDEQAYIMKYHAYNIVNKINDFILFKNNENNVNINLYTNIIPLHLYISYKYTRKNVGIQIDSSAKLIRTNLWIKYILCSNNISNISNINNNYKKINQEIYKDGIYDRNNDNKCLIIYSGEIYEDNGFRTSDSLYGFYGAYKNIEEILAIKALKSLEINIIKFLITQ
ncbi:hypothetical protein [Lyticum sinuosum]|uniref:Uncharacterized protein n=1 Tax=Lyticum sinuosum TaxID=1332059 RepID=A0AAE4VM53_9RICK|nr:hypothetical protein [Lyticum sinuosum]MDZ5761308.1 hypothetical protein [Lyticum sinuosum]